MSAAPYTYEPEAQPFTALNIARKGSPMVEAFRARVVRSDGQVVWFDGAYSDARKAKAQAGRTAARFRTYQDQNGACWFDRDRAVKDHAKAREKLRNTTARELMDAASNGTRAAFRGEPETVCPFATDTAQGITWTQAWRLTTDRLSDWADENPAPEPA